MEGISLEGQFAIITMCQSVDKMNEAQKTEMLKTLIKANVAQKEGFEKLLKHQWGLDTPVL